MAEEAGDLVEGFADGIVYGVADELVVGGAFHEVEGGVAAGDDAADGGELGFEILFDEGDEGGVEVGLDVVDADERDVGGKGEGFSCVEADEKGADEAGFIGDGNEVDGAEGEVSFFKSLLDSGDNAF